MNFFIISFFFFSFIQIIETLDYGGDEIEQSMASVQGIDHLTSSIFARLFPSNSSSIDLHDLGITTIESNTFEDYSYPIYTVILSSNSLSQLPSNIFKRIGQSLMHLSLQHNRFESLSDNYFLRRLRQLRTLDLSYNRISELFIQDFLGLKHLNTLILRDNRINYLSYGTFTYCRTITTLDLSNNQISMIDSNAFLFLKNLKVLLLSNNPLGQRVLTSSLLKPLRNLQFLDLESTQLDDLPSFLFVSNQRLRSVKLRENSFHKSASLHQTFCHANSLVEIDFVSANIRSLNTCSYYHIPSLRRLYLMNNPLDCSCDLFSLKYGDIYRLLLKSDHGLDTRHGNIENYLNRWITRLELRRHLEKAYERGDFHRFPIDLSSFARCSTPNRWAGHEIENITGIYKQCRRHWLSMEETCRDYCQISNHSTTTVRSPSSPTLQLNSFVFLLSISILTTSDI
ncbi:unnamed protein product [Adineta ricciae]|uniref:Uncharacterized protein n=1 Tax=Adineta ricciae TaxID=249248 RepID=A0A814GMM8_ADIRI|nr:unnamed protein product [Adineta ricciae]